MQFYSLKMPTLGCLFYKTVSVERGQFHLSLAAETWWSTAAFSGVDGFQESCLAICALSSSQVMWIKALFKEVIISVIGSELTLKL